MNSHKDTMPCCASGAIGSVSAAWMRDHSKPANVEPNASKQKVIDDTLLYLGMMCKGWLWDTNYKVLLMLCGRVRCM